MKQMDVKMTLRPSGSRIRRALEVLSLIQSGAALSTRDLAEICGVTRRQTFRDIALLRSCGIPIVYDEVSRIYRCSVQSTDCARDLTDQEWQALLAVGTATARENAIVPFFESAHTASLKLLTSREEHNAPVAADGRAVFDIRADVFWNTGDTRAHFERIQEAICQCHRIRIESRTAVSGRIIRTLLSPYRLLFLGRLWYVIGRSSFHRGIRTFPISRIVTSELTHDPFRVPERFSVDKYLGNAWRILRGSPRSTKVVVRLQATVAEVVSAFHWHRTQTVKMIADGSLELSVHVDGLGEFEAWLRQFGDQVEVLSPRSLREHHLRDHNSQSDIQRAG